MSFLAPLWLTLAAVAAVPLLLHLLRRRTGTRVDFPAARYLLRAEREHSRKLRLRNLLLMLLRVAAVLLVALAAARPVTRLAGTGHAPTALAIVLDNSLSTAVVVDGRPLLDALRARALAAVEQATGEDRLWLVTADGLVSGGPPATVAEAVRRVTPLAGAGDLADAARRAHALAGSVGLAERRVVVVTDGQASAWREALPGDGADVVAFAPTREVPANRAVLAAEPRPERWTPRGTLAVRVRTTDSTTYRVTLRDGAGVERTLTRGTAAADSLGRVADVLVHAAPAERGWLAGQVELPPDELRADDVRPFALWIGASPRAAVGAGVGAFARSALESIAEGPLASGGGSGGPVVAVVSADELERLPALVVAPADPVRIGAANRALERAGVPLRFGAPRRAETMLRGGRLDGIRVRQRYALQPRAPGALDTLVTAAGEPWALAGEGWVLVGSPLVPDATDLPLRAVFVPWLADLLTQRLSGEPGRVLAAEPGDTLAHPAWADAIEAGEAAPAELGAGPLVAPARTGVFFLRADGRRVGALVVAPAPDESDLARLEADDLADRLGGRRARVLTTPARFDESVFAGGGRRALAAPFLVGALLLLAIESALVRGRGPATAPRAA
jgi:hypothetical protein